LRSVFRSVEQRVLADGEQLSSTDVVVDRSAGHAQEQGQFRPVVAQRNEDREEISRSRSPARRECSRKAGIDYFAAGAVSRLRRPAPPHCAPVGAIPPQQTFLIVLPCESKARTYGRICEKSLRAERRTGFLAFQTVERQQLSRGSSRVPYTP